MHIKCTLLLACILGVSSCDQAPGAAIHKLLGTNSPDCGSETAQRLVIKKMEEAAPSELLTVAASNRDETRQELALASGKEKESQEGICLSHLRDGIDSGFASIGHPERKIGDFDLRQKNLCQLPVELTIAEDQCKVMEDKLLSQYNSCTDAEGPATSALNAFERDRQQAFHHAAYTLEDIRTTFSDKNTGTVMCAANLHVALPDPWGAASQPLIFKVEETTEHKLYVTFPPQ